MKFRTGLAAIAAAGLILSGCSSDDETTTGGLEAPPGDTTGTLKVWVMVDTKKEVYDAVTAKFKEAYPNVEVSVETQSWDGINDKLTTALSSSDSAPDVVEIGNSLTAKYIDAGLLADLTGEVGNLGVDGMLPGLKASGEYDGVRAGIPLYGGVRIVVYKKSDFEKAGITAVPTTLAELEDAAGKLQAANEDNANYSAFYFPGKNWYGAFSFVWDAGGDIATQDDSGTWTGKLNSAESQAGLTTLKGLVDNYSKAPKDGLENKNTDAFNTGNVGMMIDSWWVPDVLNAKGAKFEGDIGAFALPGTNAGTTSPVFFGGSDIALSQRGQNQALALQYLKTFTGLEMQKVFADVGGVMPNQEAAFVAHEGRPFLQIADEASKNSRFTPVSPNWAQVESSAVLQDMLVKIFTEDQTIDEATADADAKVAETLNNG